jgi:hypothetical protein
MNVEELRELAETIVADVDRTNVGTLLDQLRDAVRIQAGDLTNADYQTSVASARSTLADALRSGALDDFNPRWRGLMTEMGIDFLLPDELISAVDELFMQNQVTPQVVHDALEETTQRVSTAVTNLRQLIDSLDFLGLQSSSLGAGEFEASVLIPRGEVDNALASLGQEFEELETLIRPFVEADSGSPPPLEVRQVASSEFLAVVALAPGAAVLLSKAIDGVLAVYERILRIRSLRQELSEAGTSADLVDAIQDDATEMVDREIPAIVERVLEGAANLLADEGRRHEIEIAVTRSVRGIAKRVDHGFRLTVRAGPAPEEDAGEGGDESGDGGGDAAETLAAIRDLVIENQRRAEFHELVGEPILRELGSADPTDTDGDGPLGPDIGDSGAEREGGSQPNDAGDSRGDSESA